MPYTQPPNVASLTVTTNATANTNTTSNVIAAPGANLALRITGIHISGVPANTGKIRGQFQSTTGIIVGHMGFVPGSADDLRIPEPGIRLAPNTGLDCQHSSDIASQNLRIGVQYYIENVLP